MLIYVQLVDRRGGDRGRPRHRRPCAPIRRWDADLPQPGAGLPARRVRGRHARRDRRDQPRCCGAALPGGGRTMPNELPDRPLVL
ncbi:MAG: hypothetical protein MZW92_49940 [Comamonadaceae bacterium]|nr:hypothetical protein [Comamonadaceae bacterium]